jgi:hypothetical protein
LSRSTDLEWDAYPVLHRVNKPCVDSPALIQRVGSPAWRSRCTRRRLRAAGGGLPSTCVSERIAPTRIRPAARRSSPAFIKRSVAFESGTRGSRTVPWSPWNSWGQEVMPGSPWGRRSDGKYATQDRALGCPTPTSMHHTGSASPQRAGSL